MTWGVLLQILWAAVLIYWLLGYLFPHVSRGDRASSVCCIMGAVGFIFSAYNA